MWSHWQDAYQVFQFYIPYSVDFDSVVAMFNFNSIKVDDLCSATKDGRVVNLWIKNSDLETDFLKNKVGSFLDGK